MENINFNAPAEVFAGRSRGTPYGSLKFYRFGSAAKAVQFAIETLPSEMLFGTVIEVEEERYLGSDIRRLYESSEYPLLRISTHKKPS